MAHARLGLLLALALMQFSCRSSSDSRHGGEGGDGSNASTSANGGAAAISTGTGGSTSSTSTSYETIWAESRADGMMPITSSQAKGILDSPDTACAGWSEEPEGSAAVLEFIVDISGSMDRASPTTNGETKWVVTRRALQESITGLSSTLAVGLSFFPNRDFTESATARPVSACIDVSDNLAISPLTDAYRTILMNKLDALADNANGATPTHDAYDVGLSEIKKSTEPGDKYLVLITDGQPTQQQNCIGKVDMCEPQPVQPIIDAITEAKEDYHVETFVVGSPGSEKNACSGDDVRDWLSAAARAGGTGADGCSDSGPKYCHFDLSTSSDFGQALSDALGNIARSVVSCVYVVPAPPSGETIDTARVNMLYQDYQGDYRLVLPSRSSDCTKGWHFTDDSLAKIRICPDTCTLLQQDAEAKVTLVFGCTQEQIQEPIQ
jgi:hypothetical protein